MSAFLSCLVFALPVGRLTAAETPFLRPAVYENVRVFSAIQGRYRSENRLLYPYFLAAEGSFTYPADVGGRTENIVVNFAIAKPWGADTEPYPKLFVVFHPERQTETLQAMRFSVEHFPHRRKFHSDEEVQMYSYHSFRDVYLHRSRFHDWADTIVQFEYVHDGDPKKCYFNFAILKFLGEDIDDGDATIHFYQDPYPVETPQAPTHEFNGFVRQSVVPGSIWETLYKPAANGDTIEGAEQIWIQWEDSFVMAMQDESVSGAEVGVVRMKLFGLRELAINLGLSGDSLKTAILPQAMPANMTEARLQIDEIEQHLKRLEPLAKCPRLLNDLFHTAILKLK